LNKLIGVGDVTSAIDTFQEIEEFLKTYTNKDTLTNLLKNNSDNDKAYADSILQRYDEYIKNYISDGSTDIYNYINNTSSAIVWWV